MSAALKIDDQLRRAIAECGRACAELAREAGIDPGMVKRFADGRRDVTLATAARIADALGLKLVEAARPARRPQERSRGRTADRTAATPRGPGRAAPGVPVAE